ncbi:GtrA family protein [Salmonella enterica]|nr:GtrA family protein [Salmonella enterica]EBJ1501956.1 GtrA family protein [Salmonella enterica]EGX5006021.1 GtrA family protein [Salmonella enterica]
MIFIMLKLFVRYISVGVLNTAIHLLCFGVMFILIGFSQAISNVLEFCVDVTLSFFVNAKWMCKMKETTDGAWPFPLKVNQTYGMFFIKINTNHGY